MKDKRPISGTFEWAVANANCMAGCRHDCRYCYARNNAVNRFHTVKDGEWTNEVISQRALTKKRYKVNGTIMFPTTHDICPNTEDNKTLDACVTCLRNILEAGNDVLIVSKPHIECIEKLCDEFKRFKDKILFRFTIGALDNEILRYWEPNAPTFGERFDCLQHAFKASFQTSVSSEPMLDSYGVVQLFDVLEPYVTDGIWIGTMNNIGRRVKVQTGEDKSYVKMIKAGQTEQRIKEIYESLKYDPKIRWKESFKKVLGLELAQDAGLDK